jgi:RNA methyltransferase, TrmH family
MRSRPELRAGTRAVSSLHNERVKLIRSLEMRKARRETGLFVAEGTSLLLTAREAGFLPSILVFLAASRAAGVASELVRWAERGGAECLEVSAAVLAKLAGKDNPQNMLGVFEQRWASLPEARGVSPNALWVALEAPRDPGNLGTILRTCEAVAASGVILIGHSCDPYSHEAVRASMGSIFNVPVVREEARPFLDWRAAWQGDVVGTHLEAEEDFRRTSYRAPLLLVMGSEGPGLSAELARACSRLVKIPMAGRLDSLNLAVASALVLYEMRKDRLRLDGRPGRC